MNIPVVGTYTNKLWVCIGCFKSRWKNVYESFTTAPCHPAISGIIEALELTTIKSRDFIPYQDFYYFIFFYFGMWCSWWRACSQGSLISFFILDSLCAESPAVYSWHTALTPAALNEIYGAKRANQPPVSLLNLFLSVLTLSLTLFAHISKRKSTIIF